MDKLINKMLTDLENGLDDVQYFYFGLGEEDVMHNSALNAGTIIIEPVSTGIIPVTTGITDEDTYSVQITLVKQTKVDYNLNAQIEPGIQYLTRVMEGRNAGGTLQTNTIRYIVRNNLKQWGLLQTAVDIDYQSDRFSEQGAASSVMTLTQLDHTSQLLV